MRWFNIYLCEKSVIKQVENGYSYCIMLFQCTQSRIHFGNCAFVEVFWQFFCFLFWSIWSITVKWTRRNTFRVVSKRIDCSSQVNKKWCRSCSIKLRQIRRVKNRLDWAYNVVVFLFFFVFFLGFFFFFFVSKYICCIVTCTYVSF